MTRCTRRASTSHAAASGERELIAALQRRRVAAREYTGLGVGVASGAGGAWAGCVTLAALGSPTLVLPVVGEVAEGTLCAVGGVLGGIGVGWVGREAGKAGGEAVYDFVTTFRWE